MKVREEKRSQRASTAEKNGAGREQYKRGDDEEVNNFLSPVTFTKPYDNSELTEMSTALTPAEFWEQVEAFSLEIGKVSLERDEEKKKFVLVNEEHDIRIKVKFFECPEEKALKISFIKQKGDLLEFYKIMRDAQDYLEEHLL
jgi:hypothetical protein